MLMPLSQSGLDHAHTVAAVSSLARFHAISFCYRMENKIQMLGISVQTLH